MSEINYTKLEIKAYSSKELAGFYKVNVRTFSLWVKKITDRLGKKDGHYYTVKQVKIIFDELGLPGTSVRIKK